MKMGIVGYGNMAQWHKKTVDKIDDLEIGGIWDIQPSARDRAKVDGLFVYGSFEEMLKDTDISFVLIATDNDAHAPLAIKAMQSGKHVVCEKPITLSSKLLEEMLSVSKQTGMHLTVHQNRRWDTDFCTIEKILADGALGKVFRIESRVHGSRGISDTWRRKKEKGGGVIYDWGVHLFDQLLQLKKGVGIKSVYAVSHAVTTAFVEDGFTAILTFEDGLQAIIEVETSDFTGASRWLVFGDSGTAEIKTWDGKGKMTKAVGKDEADQIPFVTASGFTKTMAPRDDDAIVESDILPVHTDITEFYKNTMAVINGQQSALISCTEMRNVIKVIEAAFASIEKNQSVNCNLIL